MKILLITGLIILSLPFSSFAQMYKSVGPDGTVTYSDQAPKNAKPLKLMPISTIHTDKKHTASTSIAEKPKAKEKKPEVRYSTFRITSPSNNSAIRENSGSVSVQLEITPKLNTALGHAVSINLDGKLFIKGQFAQATLNNLDRGAHTVSAHIHNKQGKIIRSTSTVSFQLQRFSKLHKRAAP
ncbi:hypothetical protein MNBD_GAMMA16-1247 [hydrothermal vent metagenome]|uniref:DUF4124 domain-containing protein n=1 Tax=hydrothermal vent metagenome TaxID=652676 RepID=A0A3B0ZLA5_9ZZZZ